MSIIYEKFIIHVFHYLNKQLTCATLIYNKKYLHLYFQIFIKKAKNSC